MAFLDKLYSKKRRDDEDEERQYDTVSSSSTSISRFEKRLKEERANGTLNYDDVEKRTNPYTHHESYNPYPDGWAVLNQTTPTTPKNPYETVMYAKTLENYLKPQRMSDGVSFEGYDPKNMTGTNTKKPFVNTYNDPKSRMNLQLEPGKDLDDIESHSYLPGNKYSKYTSDKLEELEDYYRHPDYYTAEQMALDAAIRMNQQAERMGNQGEAFKNPGDAYLNDFYANTNKEDFELKDENKIPWWNVDEHLYNSPSSQLFSMKNQYDKTTENLNEADEIRDALNTRYFNSVYNAEDFDDLKSYNPDGTYSDDVKNIATMLNNGSYKNLGNQYAYIRPDEIDVFNYLLNKDGEERAMEYLDLLDLKGRRTESISDAAYAYAYELPSAVSAAASIPINAIGGIAGTIGNYANYIFNDETELDTDAWYNLPYYMSSSMRNAASQRTKDENKYGMGEVDAFMLQTLTSMGDFVFNLASGNEALALGIMAAGATESTIIEAKERGLSDGQALTLGAIAGAAEVISEKISIEALFNSDAQGVKYILQNAFSEGGEEVESDLINDIADMFISGDKAQMRKEYQDYLNSGLSESQAFVNVVKNHAGQYVLDFAGGAISGAAMGGMGAVSKYANQTNIGNTMLSSQENLNQFVNLGLQSENEETRTLAQNVADGNKKKSIIGQLVQNVSSENNLYGRIVDNLRENGETQGMAEAEAESVMRHITGQELNAQDQKYLQKENVQNALNDVFGGTYDTAYANSETAYDAYDRALEMARQQRAEKMAPVTNAINNVRNIFGNKKSGEQNNTETENNAQVSEENTQEAEETETKETVKNMPLSERAKIGAEYSKFRTEVKPVQATLNDVKAVEVTPDGLSVTLNDGQKVNTHQIMDNATRKLLEVAERNFGDTQGAEDFIKAYKENTNLPVYVNSAFKMINAGKNGMDINKALNSVTEDASYKTNGKNIPISFLNDMYAYGVREQKGISAKMNSKTQRAVTDLVAKGLGIEGLIKEGGIKEQGSYNPETNEITFGEDTNQSRIETLAHETTHIMKEHARDTYNELEKVVLDSFKENGTYQKFYDHVKELYGEEASKELIHEEMIARAMQEMLFNENVINELCKEQPSLAKRILAAIRKAIEELRAVFHGKIGTAESHQLSQDIEALEKAEKLYAKGLKEAAASVKGNENISETDEIKYAKRGHYKTDAYYEQFKPCTVDEAHYLPMIDNRNLARYRKAIDDVFAGTFGSGSVVMGMPSDVLLKHGVSNKIIRINQDTIRKIAYPMHKKKVDGIKEPFVISYNGGKHNLGISVVKNFPLQIYDPVMITENTEKHKDSIVIWTNWITEEGQGIMICVGLAKESDSSNLITTTFQTDETYARNFKGKVLYTRNNKSINQILDERRYMPHMKEDDTFIKHSLALEKEKSNENTEKTINKNKDNIKFSYAGINAIGADMASLTEAINMLEEGKSKEEVFRETGWFQGADKKWRYEISDDAMKVFPKGDAKYLNDKEYQRYQELEKTFFYGDPSTLSKEELKEFDDLYNKFLNRKSLRVDDVIQHDKLFEAYPFLRKIQIEFVKPETMNGASGRFNATEGKIYVDLYEKARLNDLKSTIIHELQHAIQNWSGYAGGASAEMYAGINSVIDSYYYEEYKDSDTAIKRLLNKAPEEFKEKYNKISESYLMYRTTQDEKYINEAHKLEEDLEANYKKLYDDLSELEAEKKFYEDLLEEEITPEKLYWITAGEIEARDTVSRINLTEEERREKYPKRTEKHKVYIKETGEYFDDRGIRYSKKDNHGRQLSEEQIEYFKDSKVRDAEGNLQVLYHQTDNDFTIFDTRRAGAGQHDYLTPYGVFLKPNSNNIGLKGNKQMELYANITNMLNVSSRYELENYLKKDADLKDAIDSMKTIDAEYQAKFDEAKNAWSNYIVENSKQGKDLRNDPELERLMDEEEKIVEAWGKEYDKRAEKVKANVDEYLRSQGYDGVHILKDEGSFGRKVETFIAFEPNQVKDVNNLNPTKNEDIRYSIKDNNGRLLSEGQIEYFKDSKVRDEQGRLIELYHGTGAEFTIFDLNEARDTEDIEAFFFSGNKEEAEGYGNIRKFYLNLKNPADYDTAYDIFFSFKRQAGAGAKTREELIKRGYDGVIAYDEDSPEYTEYLAFYPEQIKLTSNLNPTENEDIRYSLQDDWDFDWEAAMAESEEEKIAEGMVAQNDVNILEDGFRALKDIKDAGKVNISHNKAVQIAKRYTEKYDSATGAESLATSIEAVFAYIREHDVSYDDMLRVMRDVTLPVVENIRGDEQFTEEYRDFVKSLKGTSISLNESQKKEVAYAYGSMANFRKAVAGRFNIKEDGVNIDSLWPEIVEQSGYRLDEEENSNSQPIALLELLDQMKSDKGTVNRGMSDNQLALDMALNIYTDCFKEMSMNAAKVNETEVARRLEETKKILKDTVAKYEDAVDKMYKKMLADTKAQAQAEIDRLNQELRELNNIDTYNRSIDTDKRIVQLKRQIDRLKQQQEEERVYRKTSRQKARENRENSRMRNAIKSIVKDLSSRLANPNKNRYVPEDLVQATIDMLESINLDTKEGNLIKEKVQKVKDAYERLGKSTNESDASDDYDPALYNMITRLKEIFDKGKSVRRLSQSELEDVLTIAKAIQTQIKNANELIKSEIAQKIDETARGVIEDVRANRKVGNGRLEDLGNRYLNTSLNAERYFKRLVGYNEDSKMMQLYDELNEGQHKMMQIQHEVSDIFKGVLENDAEARKLTGENAKDWVDTPFKDNNGNPLKIPAGMRLSLAMHMMNEDNLKHIIYGGLTVPDMKMYNQGRKAEAYSRPMAEIKFINNEQLKDIRNLRDAAVELNDEKYTNQEREDAWAKYKDAVNKAEDQAKAKLNEIIEGMTVYERQFLESAQKYFWDYSGKQINETSMALNGYPKAMVENYFPIATDKNYTKRDIEGLKMDQTLEGWGNLKSRVHGRNPIYLENILDVISKHSNMVSKYAGLAIPIRNFNKVYNFNLEGYKGSVKQTINAQRGKTATEYIENLLTDLQGSRKADTGIFGEALGKLRGNFAGGVLTINPSVTIKQAASFPTAAAVLGWDAHNHVLLSKTGANLGLTLANPVHSMTKYTKDKMDLINQYSPLVWYRNQGNSTQELGDLKNQQTLLDKNKATKWLKSKTMNWIQNVDTTTVVALWDMAEYRVSKDTDLKKGTEEYYAEVAKWFNKAVEATQPNYTTLQRPDILRNPNEMLRNIMMFKTQPLQNLGILVDATGNLNAKTKAYKNNQTAENKAKLDEARKQFARAVSSQVVAAMVFSAMTLIAKALLHKMNPYRDDKGEITSESILEQYIKDIGSTLAGAAPGGSELYSFIMSKITGDRYYGLEVSTIEMINDLTTDLSSLYDSIKDEDADIDKIKENAGKVIMDASGIAGIPFENMINIFEGYWLTGQDVKKFINGEPWFFESGYKRSNTVNQGRLSEALLSGNEDKFEDVYDEMLDNGVEEKDINSYLKKTLADYEPEDAVEILEGVGIDEDDAYDMLSDSIKSDVKQKVIDGEMSVDKAISELEKIGYSEFDAYIQANTWEWKPDATSAVPYSGILVAIRSEDPEKIVDAVNMYLDNGYDKDTLKKYSGIKSNFADTYKKLLQTNKTAAASLKNAMLTYFRACGKSDEDAMKQIDGWLE